MAERRGHLVFIDAEIIRGGPPLEVAGHGREAWRAAPGSARAYGSKNLSRMPQKDFCNTISSKADLGRCRSTRISQDFRAKRDNKLTNLTACIASFVRVPCR